MKVRKITPWQWVAIFSMVFLWGVILLPSDSASGPEPKVPQVQYDVDHHRSLQRVNKHLQYLEKKAELERLNAEIQNYEMAHKINPREVLPPDLRPSQLEYERLEEDNQAEKIYEDLRGSSRSYDTPLTPEERINSALAMRRWAKDYEQHQTAEYVKEFIENARAQGYEVKLNDQLEVVEIHQIPKNKRYKGLSSIRELSGGH